MTALLTYTHCNKYLVEIGTNSTQNLVFFPIFFVDSTTKFRYWEKIHDFSCTFEIGVRVNVYWYKFYVRGHWIPSCTDVYPMHPMCTRSQTDVYPMCTEVVVETCRNSTINIYIQILRYLHIPGNLCTFSNNCIQKTFLSAMEYSNQLDNESI